MQVDRSCTLGGGIPESPLRLYRGIGQATEAPLPGVPWMQGLPTRFEVRFFTPAQTIFD